MSGVSVDRIHKRRRADTSDDEFVLPKKSKPDKVTSLNIRADKGAGFKVSSSYIHESEDEESDLNLDGKHGGDSGNQEFYENFRADGDKSSKDEGSEDGSNEERVGDGKQTEKRDAVRVPGGDELRYYKAKAQVLEKANQRARADLFKAWDSLAEARAERDEYKARLQAVEMVSTDTTKRGRRKEHSQHSRAKWGEADLDGVRILTDANLQLLRENEELKARTCQHHVDPETVMKALLQSGYKGRSTQGGPSKEAERKKSPRETR